MLIHTSPSQTTNCTRLITYQGDGLQWSPKPGETIHIQFFSLFRYVLEQIWEKVHLLVVAAYKFLFQITDPAEKIKVSAIRLNGRAGSNGNLKNLPDEVERTLLDERSLYYSNT